MVSTPHHASAMFPISAAAALDIQVDLDKFKVDQVGTFDYAPLISLYVSVPTKGTVHQFNGLASFLERTRPDWPPGFARGKAERLSGFPPAALLWEGSSCISPTTTTLRPCKTSRLFLLVLYHHSFTNLGARQRPTPFPVETIRFPFPRRPRVGKEAAERSMTIR